MRTFTKLPLSCLFSLVCLATAATACSDDSTAGDDVSETTAVSSTAAETSTTATEEGPMDTSTTESMSTSTTESTDTNTFVSEEGPDTGVDTAAPGNLGDQCMADGDCAPDLVCNGIAGFGGICSVCASDTDCRAGNCTFIDSYFDCGDGSEGQQCESDAVCADGLSCAEVVNLGGLFNGDFCSECKTDADCSNGQLCAPQIEFMSLQDVSGKRSCIDPNTAPNDGLCDADGNGDEQCEGFCTTADIMGFIELGVCGECETDADCMGGTCMPAMVGQSGFSGSVCG